MIEPTIYLTNHSSLLSNAQLQLVAAAVSVQIARDAAPLLGLSPVPVVFTTNPQKGYKTIDVVDVQKDPQALGWHTSEANDHLYGESSVKPLLDHGGKVLTGVNSAASVISHEVLEMWADKFCQLWADNGHGLMIAYEIGDPVESDAYDIMTSGQNISVSNFVTEEWFNPNASVSARFDYMGNLHRPFSMTKGGYWAQERTGRQTERYGHLDERFAFGDDVPEWLRGYKMSGHGRGVRKLDRMDKRRMT